MKKNRFTEFFKGKGYYVLLFVGVLAIAAVALIGSNLSNNRDYEGEDFVDLNEPNNNIAANDNNNQQANNITAPPVVADNNTKGNQTADANPNKGNGQKVANDSLLEFDVFTEEEESGIDLAQAEAAVAATPTVAPAAVETTGKTVKADNTAALSFKAEDGLLWPVEGNILMKYSMDHTIYHATLMQFKCNPAIIIDAEVGTEVKSAARGIIESIDTNEETGLTVTMNIGDGFQLIYGQLKDLKFKVGDKVNEGQVIGYIQNPTKYFSVEGSNLYFKVLENETTVNPMLYLR